MALILNKSARPIYTQLCKCDSEGNVARDANGRMIIEERFQFMPGILCEVDNKLVERLKKQKAIAKAFDEEELVDGKSAEKAGKKAAKDIKALDDKAKKAAQEDK